MAKPFGIAGEGEAGWGAYSGRWSGGMGGAGLWAWLACGLLVVRRAGGETLAPLPPPADGSGSGSDAGAGGETEAPLTATTTTGGPGTSEGGGGGAKKEDGAGGGVRKPAMPVAGWSEDGVSLLSRFECDDSEALRCELWCQGSETPYCSEEEEREPFAILVVNGTLCGKVPLPALAQFVLSPYTARRVLTGLLGAFKAHNDEPAEFCLARLSMEGAWRGRDAKDPRALRLRLHYHTLQTPSSKFRINDETFEDDIREHLGKLKVGLHSVHTFRGRPSTEPNIPYIGRPVHLRPPPP